MFKRIALFLLMVTVLVGTAGCDNVTPDDINKQAAQATDFVTQLGPAVDSVSKLVTAVTTLGGKIAPLQWPGMDPKKLEAKRLKTRDSSPTMAAPAPTDLPAPTAAESSKPTATPDPNVGGGIKK